MSPCDPTPASHVHASLDALRVGLMVADGDDRIVFANAHFHYLFPAAPRPDGLTVDAFIRATAPAFRIGVEAWLHDRVARRADGDRIMLDLPLVDGRVFTVRERPTADGGRVLLFTNETDLKRQTARLEAAIDTSSEGVAFFDETGALDQWNADFSMTMCGADGVERGARLGSILSAASASNRISLIGDPPSLDDVSDAPLRRDFLFTHSDGRTLRLRVRPAGELGSVAVLTDLSADRAQTDTIAKRGAALAEATVALRESRSRLRMQTASLLGVKEELYRARREAEDAERAKRSFLRTVSHELRTPLNSVIGFSEIIEQELYGPIGSEKYTEYAQMIRDSGRRLLRLVNRIIDVTRLEAGVSIAGDRQDIRALAKSVAAAWEAEAARSGVRVDVVIEADIGDVIADGAAARTVIENLIENAIAFTPRGGVVTVDATTLDGFVALQVSDTGEGIAPHDLERVMMPFEQAGTPQRPVGDGAGLGLAIVKSLCEAMHGAFELHSSLGRGTDAIVTLPAAPSEQDDAAAA